MEAYNMSTSFAVRSILDNGKHRSNIVEVVDNIVDSVKNESTLDLFSNYSEEKNLLLHMGQRRRDITSVTILLLVYSLIFVSGTVGNICTCIVIVRNKYMHTTTNFYLFSLAISDVLILVFGLPFEAYSIWEAYPYRFGEFFCIFKAFLTETTSYASVITITAFTIERYIAICFPLKSHRITDLRRSAKIIVVIWVFAATCALPYPIHTRTFYFLMHPVTREPVKNSYVCNIPPEWHHRMRYMFQISTFIFFMLPMTVIVVLYILIALALKKTSLIRANSEDSSKGQSQNHSMRTVLRMLFAVVVAFFLCWAPFHVQRLYTLYESQWTEFSLEVQSHLFYVSGVLYFVSSTVNPILYNLMSRRYRQAFKETLCCCFSRKMSKYERSLVNYHSMLTASNYRGYRRKTTPEFKLGHFEHSSFHNGCTLSHNLASEIQHCSVAVKLLSDTNRDVKRSYLDICDAEHFRGRDYDTTRRISTSNITLNIPTEGNCIPIPSPDPVHKSVFTDPVYAISDTKCTLEA